MIIDTHAHINFNAFSEDYDEVIRRSLDAGTWMINVGAKYESSRQAVELAEKYGSASSPQAGVYAAIGLHPIHATPDFKKNREEASEGGPLAAGEIFDKEKYLQLAKSSKKVVAIGEIGLDYYYRPKTNVKINEFKEKQKEIFVNQLNLAKELKLPVMIHCRVAHEDVIKILEGYTGIAGVIHCFTGNWEQAQKYMEMGFYIGVNGIIFKFNIDEVIKKTPLDKILIETDCPYLTPPQAGVERNEPIFVKYIAQKIAELKDISYQQVIDKTTDNAKKLFKI